MAVYLLLYLKLQVGSSHLRQSQISLLIKKSGLSQNLQLISSLSQCQVMSEDKHFHMVYYQQSRQSSD